MSNLAVISLTEFGFWLLIAALAYWGVRLAWPERGRG